MKKLAIIGNGRFGSFLKERLNALNVFRNVTAFDFWDSENIDLTSFNYIVFAVPMREFEKALIQWKPYIDKAQIIFDVCSLKTFSVELMKKHFPNNQIIATHPLFGPQSCKNGLAGQRIMIHNVSATEEAFSKFQTKLNECNLNVICCTPEFHDKQMAISQAMTHFIGRVAERMNIERIPLSTKSFDDLMDIIDLVKGGSRELFEDMQTLNTFAKEIREQFIDNAMTINKELK